MAYVALTSLMATLELQFLQPIPMPSLHQHHHHHQPLIISFFQNLSSLRQFLDIFRSRSAPRDLEIKIRDFALEAEDNIETQLSNFLLAKHTVHQEEASQQLCRTLLEAAESAAELLNITNTQKDGETERMRACDALTSLIWKIRYDYAASGKIRVDHIPPTLIESLIENLSSLRQFLEIANFHAAATAIKIKDLAAKIRDFAFNAKQDITNQSNHLRHSRFTDKHEKLSNKLLQTLQQVADNTAELLNSINNTINELEADDDEANQTQQPPIPWLKHNNASKSVNVNVKGSSLRWSEDTIMVGRQNDVTTINDRLFSSFGDLDVIPIIGMPGIGKTTFARTIFEDQLVTQHFQVKIWFTMPQKYNEIQIQRDLLQSITQVEQYEIKDGRTVSEMVQECLINRRYLIVIDDIWSTQHWKYIKDCFPSSVAGNRILLTTRLYEVAHYACPFKGNHHVMNLLDPNESWDLFCNIFPLEKYSAPRFESFRSHLSNVVEKCDGLPQAIVIVAERLLECKDNIQHELKKIEKEIELLGILDYSALTFIYNQLPEYLKVCFLYLGTFPKRSEIQVKTLLRLWIAEGFVKHLPSKNEKLEKIAYCYLKDLIDRSLVLISNWTIDGKIKTCRVHSVIHNICFREAQKEGILCAVNTQQLPRWALNAFANSCRWLSLCEHSFDYYVLFSSNNPRSIFFFQDSSEIFVSFKLLRVLAFVPSPILQRLPMHLGDLVFLRYLSVTQWFEGLNDVVSSNLNLQTLIVFGNDSESQLGVPTLHLPSTIWESRQLRHLELGALYTADPPTVVKENLQTLYWAGPTHCRKKLYSSFPNINKLKIFCKEDIEPIHIGGSSSKRIIFDNLDYLARLESLTISVSIGCIVTFPKQCMFPSQLKKLRLKGTNLSRWDLTVIGTLKCLEVLKLENAFHEEVWRVAEGGFFGLKFLLLKDKKLKRLEAYKYSFPYLERLVLRCCHYLEEIPSSFGEIFYLKSIELNRCSRPSIVASAIDIQEKLKKNFGKANFKVKIQEPEYDESGNIVECDEDVGVGKFEKANFEIKIQEPEYNGVGKFKSYIHKLKNKKWRNMLRHKPKRGSAGQADLRRAT